MVGVDVASLPRQLEHTLRLAGVPAEPGAACGSGVQKKACFACLAWDHGVVRNMILSIWRLLVSGTAIRDPWWFIHRYAQRLGMSSCLFKAGKEWPASFLTLKSRS